MRNILILTMISALAIFTACQKVGSANKTDNAKTNATAPQANTDDFQRISLEDAKKEFDAGTAIIVDARAEVAYKNERIKGSISLPMESFEARYKEIPTDKKIITYCSCPSEHTSGAMVSKLKEKGITNAYALTGGTNAWKSAGYPMDKSEDNPK